MKNGPKLLLMSFASASLLAGCAMGAMGGMQEGARAHLSPTQCTDLTALRHHEPLTRERNSSELSALEEAGYHPSLYWDPYYPEDLQTAQIQVDRWYQTECPQTRQE